MRKIASASFSSSRAAGRVEVKELHAGDIGALAKLTKTLTTDSLSTRNMPVTYLRTSISKPYVAMRYKAKKKGDEDKISQSLQKLLMEDLTLNSVNDSEKWTDCTIWYR